MRSKVGWGLGLALVLGLVGVGGGLITLHLLAEHHLGQARLAIERQRLPQAWDHLSKAKTFRPGSPEVHLLLARVARRMHNFKEADACLEKARALRGGRQTEAEQLERLMLRAETGNVEEVYPQLWVYVKEDRPEAPLVLEALAYGFLGQRLVLRAEECLGLLLKKQSDNIEALEMKGMLSEFIGAREEATARYSRVLELDPDREESRLRLADVCLKQQHDKQALKHFQRLLQQKPGSKEARLGAAQAHRGLGNLPAARAIVDEFLREFPDDPQAWEERGRIALEEGDHAEAEKWLRRVLEKKPNETEVLYGLVGCLRRLGRADEAAPYARKMDQINRDAQKLGELFRSKFSPHPNDVETLYEMGVLAERTGQEEEADRWFARALKEDPYHQPTLKALIKRLEKAGDKDRDLIERLRARLAQK